MHVGRERVRWEDYRVCIYNGVTACMAGEDFVKVYFGWKCCSKLQVCEDLEMDVIYKDVSEVVVIISVLHGDSSGE